MITVHSFPASIEHSDPAGSDQTLEGQILQILFEHRRLLPDGPCATKSCPHCLTPHLGRITGFIRRGEPIHLVLPSFPAKSPNPRKVLGRYPDLAERLAVEFLQRLTERIRAIYAPGARITICSDGRVFSDLVRVPDADVTAYSRELQTVLNDQGANALDLFGLDDALPDQDYDALRRRLVERYGVPLDELRRLIQGGGPQLATFNGIARFLFEDFLVLEPGKSRTAIRTTCKDLAYRMIQRSMAWGNLVKEWFPDAVRLSIHPQPCHSEKIGIYLVDTLDNWLTPWHGVAVQVGGRYVLMKRFQAEALGASLVRTNGRPSHFTLPDTTSKEIYTCCVPTN